MGNGGDGEKDYEPDPEFHRKYIFAGHVAEFMTKLKDEDEEAYKKQFGRFIKEGIEPEDLEGIYENAHKLIRQFPFKRREPLKLGRFKTREKRKDRDVKYEHKKWPCHPIKLTIDQRKQRIREKLKAMGKTRVYKVAAAKKRKVKVPIDPEFIKEQKRLKLERLEQRKKNKKIASTPRSWKDQRAALENRKEFFKLKRKLYLEKKAKQEIMRKKREEKRAAKQAAEE